MPQDLGQTIAWLCALDSPLRNCAHASRVRQLLSSRNFPELTGEETHSHIVFSCSQEPPALPHPRRPC